MATKRVVPVVPIKPQVSCASLPTEELASVVIGAFTKIRDVLPYVVELRKRFADAPKGKANIAGCDTWVEFCEKHLHRTPSAIRLAFQNFEVENPAAKFAPKTKPQPDAPDPGDAPPTSVAARAVRPIDFPEPKTSIAISDHTARLTEMFQAFTDLNQVAKLKPEILDAPTRRDIVVLVNTLRKISKDAARRADILANLTADEIRVA